MFEYLALGVTIVLALLALIRLAKRPFSPPSTTPFPPALVEAYAARPSLLVNRSELALFHALAEAASPGLHVMTKVRLEDIIGVRSDVRGERAWELRARVKSRHVDFCITDGSGRPLAVIELDGSSHDSTTRNADELKNALFAASPILFHRIRVGDNFRSASRELFAQLNHH